MQDTINTETFRAPLVLPENVARLKLCRKYIYLEFGIKLAFSQPDLLDEIQHFADKSKDHRLKRLAYELERSLASAA